VQEKLENLYFAYSDVEHPKPPPDHKVKLEPEPHLFPEEIIQARKEYYEEVRRQHEEDAKHWTYPVSYPTEEEVTHQKERRAERMKESAKTEAVLPDEHHCITPEILDKEIEQQQQRKQHLKAVLIEHIADCVQQDSEDDIAGGKRPLTQPEILKNEIEKNELHIKDLKEMLSKSVAASSDKEADEIPDECHSLSPYVLEKEIEKHELHLQCLKEMLSEYTATGEKEAENEVAANAKYRSTHADSVKKDFEKHQSVTRSSRKENDASTS